MSALSRGIKISAVHCLVLSQSTRVTDIQTDRISTPKTALAQLRRAVKRSQLNSNVDMRLAHNTLGIEKPKYTPDNT